MIDTVYVEVDSDEGLIAKASRVEEAIGARGHTVATDRDKNRLVVSANDCRDAVDEITDLLDAAGIPSYVYD